MAAVKVVLQPRLGWPWQFEDGRLSTTFGEILDAYASQNAYGWHSSCYSLWVGDQLVRRDMALPDVTNGSIGLVVCTLHTPDDTAAQKVAKSLALLQKQVPGDGIGKKTFDTELGKKLFTSPKVFFPILRAHGIKETFGSQGNTASH